MKECSCCHKIKPLSDFYRRKLGSRSGECYNHCKFCLKSRARKYYNENRVRQSCLSNLRRIEYRKTRKKFIINLKDKPCVDCGCKYPHYVMDFDHRSGVPKIDNISHLVNQNFLTYEQILEEVKKCDLVCANCHRVRTFTRLKNSNTLK